MNKKEIEHLESINPFYEKGDHMDALMIEREIEIIKQYNLTGKSALEVGCGSGLSTEKLCDLFDDIEVIEPAPKNIDLLRRRVPNVICHNVLLEDFNTQRKYDFIFFLNVIEHVEDPISSLRALSHLVKDEGLIFISGPNCMSLNRRAGYKMGLLKGYDQMAPKDYEVGHRRLYTVDMLTEHCEEAGLKILSMKGMYLKPLAESQMIKLGDEVIRAFYALGEDTPQLCASLLAIATKKYY
ncbi:class I SAM-dependent methyltransferase [Polynucleobacter sp. 71A-WALBACH]|uniref:class I SAM-dependent methyltransferase n=1 Tax=Polynucleobacter sp. 71A-WALBACH TaxID=2689097 RepID=UPI001C0C5176|nr:class I SAM-dependent methyltransferase [Polynucleobacter sp. 71A-WALBACH]MBU3593273.1 class I SAM-dependent methyltransferase [Polynucleobacter sp. 71A-WALBACH]